MHTGRMPCEDEERDWGDALQAKEHQRWLANDQNLELRPATDSPSQPHKEPTLLTP